MMREEGEHSREATGPVVAGKYIMILMKHMPDSFQAMGLAIYSSSCQNHALLSHIEVNFTNRS